MNRQIVRTAFIAALLGFIPVAQAQPAPEAPTAPPAQDHSQSYTFSDTELERFADVQPALQEVRTEYAGKLEQADDAEQAARLQEEAGQEMVEVLQENGMDVETYNQIAAAIQQDQALRARVEELMN